MLTSIYEPMSDTQRIITLLPFLQYTKQKTEQLFKKPSPRPFQKSEQKQYDTDLLDWELKKLKEKYQIPIILLYIPTTPVIDYDTVRTTNDDFYPILENHTQKHDITLINMKKPFEQTYQQIKQLPRGFENTSPGNGHINELGHKLVAEELTKVLKKILTKEGDHAL
jgi:lysophospholipase L1-like esterase